MLKPISCYLIIVIKIAGALRLYILSVRCTYKDYRCAAPINTAGALHLAASPR